MPYAAAFVALSVACVAVAWPAWLAVGWPAAFPLYAALSSASLAAAYAGAGAGLVLKRADGRLSAGSWLLFDPYLLFNGLAFAAYRLASREPATCRVSAKLWLGRRLSAGESAAGGWVSVLDLAAEFAEAPPLRRLPDYLSLPVLDGAAPTAAQLRRAVAWLAATDGPAYVHYALGHGRSACVVVAFWLAAGEVGTVAEGERRLRALRPGVRLNPAQRRALQEFAPARM